MSSTPPKVRKYDDKQWSEKKVEVDFEQVSSSKCFNGYQKVFKHQSKVLNCEMKFSIYLPEAVFKNFSEKFPVVYFLSGLTCTEQNFITKSAFQRHANENNLIIVGPDTSPRGLGVPTSPDGAWDLGLSASFYVDATQPPWNQQYKMYTYITTELREVVEKNFGCVDKNRVGISGHSMGGHGALVCFLKNPQIYRCATAFAPISNPLASAWGRKALSTYLGSDENAWKEYDATELVKVRPRKSDVILVDQGDQDEWMHELNPENFVKACEAAGQPIIYKKREGYDHGYYYVSTFIADHMKYFAEKLA